MSALEQAARTAATTLAEVTGEATARGRDLETMDAEALRDALGELLEAVLGPRHSTHPGPGVHEVAVTFECHGTSPEDAARAVARELAEATLGFGEHGDVVALSVPAVAFHWRERMAEADPVDERHDRTRDERAGL